MGITLVTEQSTLGQKRECPTCGVRFYDFGNKLSDCTVCGANMVFQAVTRSRRSTIATEEEDDDPTLMGVEVDVIEEVVEPDDKADEVEFVDIETDIEDDDSDIDDDNTFIEDEDSDSPVDEILGNSSLDDDDSEE